MPKLEALTGNEAAATAFKQVNPDVAAVYPITPQTELMHQFCDFAANGEVATEIILVESEHSAMSACVGASAAGARVMTATSANGLALMWEVVYIAASLRLPIVMAEVNRALSGPINIHCDHSDTMGCRDSGWIQIYCENSQEAYDSVFQAFRIAEHPDVLLPTMITFDGFIISHTTEGVELLPDDKVKAFVGSYKPDHPLLDTEHPYTVGPLDLQNYYFEHKRQEIEAMTNAMRVIPEVGREFGKMSGRSYGFFEEYKLQDADVALVALGSTAGTAKAAIDDARAKGIKAGLLKLRVFRPFPGNEIAKALAHVPVIGVMDRAVSFGLVGGPVFNEIRSFAYGGKSRFYSYIYGLGGRDISAEEIAEVISELDVLRKSGGQKELMSYVGLRE